MFCKQNAYPPKSLEPKSVLQRIHTKPGTATRKLISKQDFLQPYFDCEFSDVHSSRIAQNIERYIKIAKKYQRETKLFVEAVLNKIYLLHKYNLKVAEVTFRYPLTPNFTQLLSRYLVLECSVLYKGEHHTRRYAATVEERVLKLLQNVYNAYLESLNSVPPDKLFKERCKAILNLLIRVKSEFEVQNDLMENIAEKLLIKMGRLEQVNALKGRSIPCPSDTFLSDPAVVNTCRNIITSDYGTDDNLKIEEEVVQVGAQNEDNNNPHRESDVRRDISEILHRTHEDTTTNRRVEKTPSPYIEGEQGLALLEDEIKSSTKPTRRKTAIEEQRVESRERQCQMFLTHKPLHDVKPYVKDEVIDLVSDEECGMSKNGVEKSNGIRESSVVDGIIVLDDDDANSDTARSIECKTERNEEDILELDSDEDDSFKVIPKEEEEELLRDETDKINSSPRPVGDSTNKAINEVEETNTSNSAEENELENTAFEKDTIFSHEAISVPDNFVNNHEKATSDTETETSEVNIDPIGTENGKRPTNQERASKDLQRIERKEISPTDVSEEIQNIEDLDKDIEDHSSSHQLPDITVQESEELNVTERAVKDSEEKRSVEDYLEPITLGKSQIEDVLENEDTGTKLAESRALEDEEDEEKLERCQEIALKTENEDIERKNIETNETDSTDDAKIENEAEIDEVDTNNRVNVEEIVEEVAENRDEKETLLSSCEEERSNEEAVDSNEEQINTEKTVKKIAEDRVEKETLTLSREVQELSKGETVDSSGKQTNVKKTAKEIVEGQDEKETLTLSHEVEGLSKEETVDSNGEQINTEKIVEKVVEGQDEEETLNLPHDSERLSNDVMTVESNEDRISTEKTVEKIAEGQDEEETLTLPHGIERLSTEEQINVEKIVEKVAEAQVEEETLTLSYEVEGFSKEEIVDSNGEQINTEKIVEKVAKGQTEKETLTLSHEIEGLSNEETVDSNEDRISTEETVEKIAEGSDEEETLTLPQEIEKLSNGEQINVEKIVEKVAEDQVEEETLTLSHEVEGLSNEETIGSNGQEINIEKIVEKIEELLKEETVDSKEQQIHIKKMFEDITESRVDSNESLQEDNTESIDTACNLAPSDVARADENIVSSTDPATSSNYPGKRENDTVLKEIPSDTKTVPDEPSIDSTETRLQATENKGTEDENETDKQIKEEITNIIDLSVSKEKPGAVQEVIAKYTEEETTEETEIEMVTKGFENDTSGIEQCDENEISGDPKETSMSDPFETSDIEEKRHPVEQIIEEPPETRPDEKIIEDFGETTQETTKDGEGQNNEETAETEEIFQFCTVEQEIELTTEDVEHFELIEHEEVDENETAVTEKRYTNEKIAEVEENVVTETSEFEVFPENPFEETEKSTEPNVEEICYAESDLIDNLHVQKEEIVTEVDTLELVVSEEIIISENGSEHATDGTATTNEIIPLEKSEILEICDIPDANTSLDILATVATEVSRHDSLKRKETKKTKKTHPDRRKKPFNSKGKAEGARKRHDAPKTKPKGTPDVSADAENKRVTRSAQKESRTEFYHGAKCKPHDFVITDDAGAPPPPSNNIYAQKLSDIPLTSEDSNDSEGNLQIDEDDGGKVGEPPGSLCYNENTMEENLAFFYEPKVKGTVLISIPDTCHGNFDFLAQIEQLDDYPHQPSAKEQPNGRVFGTKTDVGGQTPNSKKKTHKPFKTKAEQKDYDKFSMDPYVSIERLNVSSESERKGDDNVLKDAREVEIKVFKKPKPKQDRIDRLPKKERKQAKKVEESDDDTPLLQRSRSDCKQAKKPVKFAVELKKEKASRKIDASKTKSKKILGDTKENKEETTDSSPSITNFVPPVKKEGLEDGTTNNDDEKSTAHNLDEGKPENSYEEAMKSSNAKYYATPKLRRKSVSRQNLNRSEKSNVKSDETKRVLVNSDKKYYTPPKLRRKSMAEAEVTLESTDAKRIVPKPIKLSTPKVDILSKCKNTISPTTEKLKKKLEIDFKLNTQESPESSLQTLPEIGNGSQTEDPVPQNDFVCDVSKGVANKEPERKYDGRSLGTFPDTSEEESEVAKPSTVASSVIQPIEVDPRQPEVCKSETKSDMSEVLSDLEKAIIQSGQVIKNVPASNSVEDALIGNDDDSSRSKRPTQTEPDDRQIKKQPKPHPQSSSPAIVANIETEIGEQNVMNEDVNNVEVGHKSEVISQPRMKPAKKTRKNALIGIKTTKKGSGIAKYNRKMNKLTKLNKRNEKYKNNKQRYKLLKKQHKNKTAQSKKKLRRAKTVSPETEPKVISDKSETLKGESMELIKPEKVPEIPSNGLENQELSEPAVQVEGGTDMEQILIENPKIVEEIEKDTEIDAKPVPVKSSTSQERIANENNTKDELTTKTESTSENIVNVELQNRLTELPTTHASEELEESKEDDKPELVSPKASSHSALPVLEENKDDKPELVSPKASSHSALPELEEYGNDDKPDLVSPKASSDSALPELEEYRNDDKPDLISPKVPSDSAWPELEKNKDDKPELVSPKISSHSALPELEENKDDDKPELVSPKASSDSALPELEENKNEDKPELVSPKASSHSTLPELEENIDDDKPELVSPKIFSDSALPELEENKDHDKPDLVSPKASSHSVLLVLEENKDDDKPELVSPKVPSDSALPELEENTKDDKPDLISPKASSRSALPELEENKNEGKPELVSPKASSHSALPELEENKNDDKSELVSPKASSRSALPEFEENTNDDKPDFISPKVPSDSALPESNNEDPLDLSKENAESALNHPVSVSIEPKVDILESSDTTSLADITSNSNTYIERNQDEEATEEEITEKDENMTSSGKTEPSRIVEEVKPEETVPEDKANDCKGIDVIEESSDNLMEVPTAVASEEVVDSNDYSTENTEKSNAELNWNEHDEEIVKETLEFLLQKVTENVETPNENENVSSMDLEVDSKDCREKILMQKEELGTELDANESVEIPVETKPEIGEMVLSSNQEWDNNTQLDVLPNIPLENKNSSEKEECNDVVEDSIDRQPENDTITVPFEKESDIENTGMDKVQENSDLESNDAEKASESENNDVTSNVGETNDEILNGLPEKFEEQPLDGEKDSGNKMATEEKSNIDPSVNEQVVNLNEDENLQPEAKEQRKTINEDESTVSNKVEEIIEHQENILETVQSSHQPTEDITEENSLTETKKVEESAEITETEIKEPLQSVELIEPDKLENKEQVTDLIDDSEVTSSSLPDPKLPKEEDGTIETKDKESHPTITDLPNNKSDLPANKRKRKNNSSIKEISTKKKSKPLEIKIDVSGTHHVNSTSPGTHSPLSTSPKKKEKRSIECIISQLKEEKESCIETNDESVKFPLVTVDVGTLKKKLLQKITGHTLSKDVQKAEVRGGKKKVGRSEISSIDLETNTPSDNLPTDVNSTANTLCVAATVEMECNGAVEEESNGISSAENVQEAQTSEIENASNPVEEPKALEFMAVESGHIDGSTSVEAVTSSSTSSVEDVDTIETSTPILKEPAVREVYSSFEEGESVKTDESEKELREPIDFSCGAGISDVFNNNEENKRSIEETANKMLNIVEESPESEELPAAINTERIPELSPINEISSKCIPLTNPPPEQDTPKNLEDSPDQPKKSFSSDRLEKKSIADSVNSCVEGFDSTNVETNLLNLCDLMLQVDSVGNVARPSEAVCMLSNIISTSISSTTNKLPCMSTAPINFTFPVTTQSDMKDRCVPMNDIDTKKGIFGDGPASAEKRPPPKNGSCSFSLNERIGEGDSEALGSSSISLNLQEVDFSKIPIDSMQAFDLISSNSVMQSSAGNDFINEITVDNEESDVAEARNSNAIDHNYTMEPLGGPLLSEGPEEEHIFSSAFNKNLVDSIRFPLNDNQLPSELSESDDTYKLNLDNEYAVKNLVMLGGQTSDGNSFPLSNYNLSDIKRMNLIEDNISNSEDNSSSNSLDTVSLVTSMEQESRDVPNNTWTQFIVGENPSETVANPPSESFSIPQNDLLRPTTLTSFEEESAKTTPIKPKKTSLEDLKGTDLWAQFTANEDLGRKVVVLPNEQYLASSFSISQNDFVQSTTLMNSCVDNEIILEETPETNVEKEKIKLDNKHAKKSTETDDKSPSNRTKSSKSSLKRSEKAFDDDFLPKRRYSRTVLRAPLKKKSNSTDNGKITSQSKTTQKLEAKPLRTTSSDEKLLPLTAEVIQKDLKPTLKDMPCTTLQNELPGIPSSVAGSVNKNPTTVKEPKQPVTTEAKNSTNSALKTKETGSNSPRSLIDPELVKSLAHEKATQQLIETMSKNSDVHCNIAELVKSRKRAVNNKYSSPSPAKELKYEAPKPKKLPEKPSSKTPVSDSVQQERNDHHKAQRNPTDVSEKPTKSNTPQHVSDTQSLSETVTAPQPCPKSNHSIESILNKESKPCPDVNPARDYKPSKNQGVKRNSSSAIDDGPQKKQTKPSCADAPNCDSQRKERKSEINTDETFDSLVQQGNVNEVILLRVTEDNKLKTERKYSPSSKPGGNYPSARAGWEPKSRDANNTRIPSPVVGSNNKNPTAAKEPRQPVATEAKNLTDSVLKTKETGSNSPSGNRPSARVGGKSRDANKFDNSGIPSPVAVELKNLTNSVLKTKETGSNSPSGNHPRPGSRSWEPKSRDSNKFDSSGISSPVVGSINKNPTAIKEPKQPVAAEVKNLANSVLKTKEIGSNSPLDVSSKKSDIHTNNSELMKSLADEKSEQLPKPTRARLGSRELDETARRESERRGNASVKPHGKSRDANKPDKQRPDRNSPLMKPDGRAKEQRGNKQHRSSFHSEYHQYYSGYGRGKERPYYPASSEYNGRREGHHSDDPTSRGYGRRREGHHSDDASSRGYNARRDGHHSDNPASRQHYFEHGGGGMPRTSGSSHPTAERSSNVSGSYYKKAHKDHGEEQPSHSSSRHGSGPYTKRGAILTQEKQEALLKALQDMVHQQLNSSGVKKSSAAEDYAWLDKFNEFNGTSQFSQSSSSQSKHK